MSRAKTLTVTRPSPSTTAYTVSNASIPRSTLAVLLHRLNIALRVLLAGLCVCIILGQYRTAIGSLTGNAATPTLDSGDAGGRAGSVGFASAWQWLLLQVEQGTGMMIGEQTGFGKAVREQFGSTTAAWIPLALAGLVLWMLVQRGYVGMYFVLFCFVLWHLRSGGSILGSIDALLAETLSCCFVA